MIIHRFSPRQIGFLAAFVGLLLMLFLIIAAIQVTLNPVPQTLQRIDGSAQISFAVDRTQFVFPSTCATVKWKVEHIKEIYVLDRGVVGEGQLELCNGDAPILRVKLEDDVIHTYQLNRNVLMVQPLAAAGGILALGLWLVAAYCLGLERVLRTRRGEYTVVLLLAVGLIVLMSLYTRSDYTVVDGTLDPARTMMIARDGWLGNPNMIAPWAYRPVTPLAARLISDVLKSPLETGFAILSVSGMTALLMLVYTYARTFGADFRAGAVIMLVVWLSYYNVRFSLADIYRPDSWAYALVVLALLCLQRKWFGCCLLICGIGTLVREFMVIPAVVLALTLLVQVLRERSVRAGIWLVVTAIMMGAVIILPRALIPVVASAQVFDPQHNPQGTLYGLYQPLINWPRNTEFLVAAIMYLLPLLLLVTPARIIRAWSVLAKEWWQWGLYIGLTLLLTMYGGSGLYRYISYLFILLAVVLAMWLPDISWREIVGMLVVVAICNRLFWAATDPVSYHMHVREAPDAAAYIPRLLELLSYVGIVWTGRIVVRLLSHRKVTRA